MTRPAMTRPAMTRPAMTRPAGVPRPRRPRAEVEGTGVLVPAALLRVAVLAAGGLLAVLLVAGRPAGWPVVALVGLTIGCAWAPGSLLVGVLGLLAVGVQLGYGVLDPRAVVTALALYLTWLACALAAAVPAEGRVEAAALLPALRRSGGVAALTALVVAAAAGARAGGVRAGEQLLLLVGLVLLAGGVVVAVLVWGRRSRA